MVALALMLLFIYSGGIRLGFTPSSLLAIS